MFVPDFSHLTNLLKFYGIAVAPAGVMLLFRVGVCVLFTHIIGWMSKTYSARCNSDKVALYAKSGSWFKAVFVLPKREL